MTTQEAVRQLRNRGFHVCRILPGEKLPGYAGWSSRTLEPADFTDADSVGIVCGPVDAERSLVCIDLDSAAAIARADEFLPPTGMIDGRAGKPRSHRWYTVRSASVPPEFYSKAPAASAAAIARCGHAGPKTLHGFRDADGKTVCDFQGTGAQCVVPPSVHSSGERREWDGGKIGVPTESDYLPLLLAVCKLVEAIGGTVPDAKRDEQAPQPAPQSGLLDYGAVQRYNAYLQAVVDSGDLPRSGHGGDPKTYRLLATGIEFGLAPDQVHSAFCAIINTALKAVRDAWSEDELRRKISEAVKCGVHSAVPRPAKLPPMRWDDARKLASTIPGADAIRFQGEIAYKHDGKRYAELPAVAVKDAMRRHAEKSAEEYYAAANQRYIDAVEAAEKWIEALKQRLEEVRNDASQAAAVSGELKEAKEKRKSIKPPPNVVDSVSAACVANAVESLRAARALPPRTPFNVELSCLACPPRNFLAVQNGILDLADCTLHPHTADWFSPVLLPVEFKPDAPAPVKFADMLHKVTVGDAALAAVLQEVVGACLDPWCSVQHFTLLVGEGANGKSTFLTVLRALLGAENVSGVDLASLSINRFASYQLLGKLANISGDAAYFESQDTSILKRLTGGDVLEFEKKGMQSVSGVNTAKLIAGCNELPRLRDRSEGIWRRAVLVPFNWRVPKGEQNPAVLRTDYWQAELPGVLNWAVEGLKRLRARGEFDLPPACKALIHEHRLDSNPARRFLEEHYRESDAERYAIASDMFTLYRQWCAENGIKFEMASNTFGKEVPRTFARAREGQKKTGGVNRRAWFGIEKVAAVPEGSGITVTPQTPEIIGFAAQVTAVIAYS